MRPRTRRSAAELELAEVERKQAQHRKDQYQAKDRSYRQRRKHNKAEMPNRANGAIMSMRLTFLRLSIAHTYCMSIRLYLSYAMKRYHEIASPRLYLELNVNLILDTLLIVIMIIKCV